MKIKLYLTLVIVSSLSNNFSPEHIEKLKNLKERKKDITFGDLIHENPGCLENSTCSKQNGKNILKWKKLNTIKEIEAFRKDIGLPIQVLMMNKDTISLDPIVFDSRCKSHKANNKKESIVKAILFLRNNPRSEKVIFTKVQDKASKVIYQIPYGEQPLYIKHGKLHLISDFEHMSYGLSISKDNKWQAVKLSSPLMRKAIQQKESANCKKTFKPSKYFQGSYCNKIWNEDTKKTVIIEQSWSCP